MSCERAVRSNRLFRRLSTHPDLPLGKCSKKALRTIAASADDEDQLYFETSNRDKVDGRNDCESEGDEEEAKSFPEQVDNSLVAVASHEALSRVEDALLMDLLPIM